MTKTAFSYWNDRIAPLFDTAILIHFVETESGLIIHEANLPFAENPPSQKALRLAELGANTLVCGAISRSLHAQVAAYGIKLIPFIAGDLHEVITAWQGGNFKREFFAMPGCCRPGHRRFHRMSFVEHEAGADNRKERSKGRGGQGCNRMRGSEAGGTAGTCLCPACGHREVHETGMPCVQKQCPECGTALIREK